MNPGGIKQYNYKNLIWQVFPVPGRTAERISYI